MFENWATRDIVLFLGLCLLTLFWFVMYRSNRPIAGRHQQMPISFDVITLNGEKQIGVFSDIHDSGWIAALTVQHAEILLATLALCLKSIAGETKPSGFVSDAFARTPPVKPLSAFPRSDGHPLH